MLVLTCLIIPAARLAAARARIESVARFMVQSRWRSRSIAVANDTRGYPATLFGRDWRVCCLSEGKMPTPTERRQQIVKDIDVLDDKVIPRLSRKYGVSEMTIRRDLK